MSPTLTLRFSSQLRKMDKPQVRSVVLFPLTPESSSVVIPRQTPVGATVWFDIARIRARVPVGTEAIVRASTSVDPVAVLRPSEDGGLPVPVRASLACNTEFTVAVSPSPPAGARWSVEVDWVPVEVANIDRAMRSVVEESLGNGSTVRYLGGSVFVKGPTWAK